MKVYDNSFGSSIAVVYNSNITITTTAAPDTGTAPEIASTPQNTGTNPAVTSAASRENAPIITETRTENGAVYIEEVTEEDGDEPEEIGEGGMEEDEDVIIDITPAETSVPDYIVIAPGTGTVSEALTTKPLEDVGAVSTASENSGKWAATDKNGEAAAPPTSASEDKPTATEGENTEAGENAPANENNPEASAEKPQGSNTLLYVMIYVGAVIAVAAVAIVVLVKRKK